jgi:hypothetical protein
MSKDERKESVIALDTRDEGADALLLTAVYYM